MTRHLCIICGRQYQTSKSHHMESVCQMCREKRPELYGAVRTLLTQNARARAAGVRADLTLTEWIRTIDDFGGRCAYCGQRPYTVMEHYVAIRFGGGTTASNCVPACGSCNVMKAKAELGKAAFPVDALERVGRYLTRRAA